MSKEITAERRKAMELAARLALREPIIEFVVAMDEVGKAMVKQGLAEEEANTILNDIYSDFAEQVQAQGDSNTIAIAIRV